MNKFEWKVVLGMALRILIFQLVFGFLGLMLIPAVLEANDILRMILSLALIVLGALFSFSQAATVGEQHCAAGERLDKSVKVRGYQPTLQENAQRYGVKKALLGAVLGGAILFVLSAILAITTRPYAYTLQSYPSWLSTYSALPELGEALSYMESAPAAMAEADVVRVIVRFMLFPFVGVVGDMSNAVSLLFDRLTPVMSLLFPLSFFLGYLQGPSRRAAENAAVEAAKNQPRRRLKKEAKKRLMQKKTQEKKNLI